MSNTPTRDTPCVSSAADRFSARGPSAPRTALKWYELEADVVLEALKADASVGLTTPESAERLSTYGSNELEGRGLKSGWLIVWEQLTSLMMLILLAAAAVSIFLGDYSDSIAIGAILALNVLLGFAQEYRAEKARNKSCRVPEKCRSLPNESGCLRSREFPPIFPCYPW